MYVALVKFVDDLLSGLPTRAIVIDRRTEASFMLLDLSTPLLWLGMLLNPSAARSCMHQRIVSTANVERVKSKDCSTKHQRMSLVAAVTYADRYATFCVSWAP